MTIPHSSCVTGPWYVYMVPIAITTAGSQFDAAAGGGFSEEPSEAESKWARDLRNHWKTIAGWRGHHQKLIGIWQHGYEDTAKRFGCKERPIIPFQFPTRWNHSPRWEAYFGRWVAPPAFQGLVVPGTSSVSSLHRGAWTWRTGCGLGSQTHTHARARATGVCGCLIRIFANIWMTRMIVKYPVQMEQSFCMKESCIYI